MLNYKNLPFNTALTTLLIALLSSSFSITAFAKTPGNCIELLSAFNDGRGASVTGTRVGKTETNWSTVMLLTSPSFDGSNWKPADKGATRFPLSDYSGYMRGRFQGIQVYALNGAPFSDLSDLWISDSGRVWSRSITWNSSWAEWQNVTCYSAPNSTDGQDGTPLGRIFLTAFNPEGGSNGGAFMTLEIRENQYLY